MTNPFTNPPTKNLESQHHLLTSSQREYDSSPAEELVFIKKVSISDLNINESPNKSGSVLKSEIIVQSMNYPLNTTVDLHSNKDYLSGSQFVADPTQIELNINPEIYFELNKRLYMLNQGIEHLNKIEETQNIPFLETQKKCTELWIDMMKKGHPFDVSKIKYNFNSELLFGITDEQRKLSYYQLGIQEMIELIKERNEFLKILEANIQDLIVTVNITRTLLKAQ